MKRGTPRHIKTHMLAHLLGERHSAVVGLLELFWHWAAENAQDGDISAWPGEVIKCAIMYDGECTGEEMIAAMEQARWLDRQDDGRLLIHDWPEHCEESVHKALQRRGARFADGSAPFDRKSATEAREAPDKGTTGARQGRDKVTTGARQGRDKVTTEARRGRDQPGPGPLPGPGPGPGPLPKDPDESVSGLGMGGARDGPHTQPMPSPKTQSVGSGLRTPSDAPDGIDRSDWIRACACADLLESPGLWGDVQGSGETKRALGLALFVEWWVSRPWCSDRDSPWDEIEEALQAVVDQPQSEDKPLVVGLRKYPDSTYPNTGAKGAPSRLERLMRNHMDRRRANPQPRRTAGTFATPQPTI